MTRPTNEVRKQRLIPVLDDYIKEHGKKYGNYIVWSTGVICVRDKCVTSAVIDLETNETIFCDFNTVTLTYNKNHARKYDELYFNNVDSILSDMKNIDSKKHIN